MDKVKKNLECTICLTEYNENNNRCFQIDCGHSFCHHCIRMIEDTADEHPKCPMCKRKFNKMTRNWLIHNIIDDIKSQENKETEEKDELVISGKDVESKWDKWQIQQLREENNAIKERAKKLQRQVYDLEWEAIENNDEEQLTALAEQISELTDKLSHREAKEAVLEREMEAIRLHALDDSIEIISLRKEVEKYKEMLSKYTKETPVWLSKESAKKQHEIIDISDEDEPTTSTQAFKNSKQTPAKRMRVEKKNDEDYDWEPPMIIERQTKKAKRQRL